LLFDDDQFLISYANKNERGVGWLAPNHEAMKQLEHPLGFFTFAFIDRDKGKAFFLEVPMQTLSQKIEAIGLKPGLQGDRYGLTIEWRQDQLYLGRVNLEAQSYLTGEVPIQRPIEVQPPSVYTAERFLAETYLTLDILDELTALLEDKQQIILYGPPGTGKTYVAQKFARYFVGGDEDRVQIIQFHPSYSYEEFIEGIRPEARDDGPPRYPIRPGIFRAFCEEARGQDGRFVMIVDEINRGNIAKIFGELMFLLEYRDRSVPLAYSGLYFLIPDNVYLIGTMNTADRSIALVDFALRRRFHFVHFGADRGVLARWIEANDAPVPYLLDLFDAVNRAIDDRDYQIGFSYFMKPGLTEADLRRVWRYSIEPYLEEYFFDNRAKVEELRWNALVPRLQGNEGWTSSACRSINSWPVNPFPDRLPRSFATASTSM
jgi:hypothetical protein